jgi:hypothetical protein
VANPQLAVRRDAADNVLVTVEHMKDGLEGDVIASRLGRVELGSDEDGDPMTSCVIVPVEISDTRAAEGPRLTKNQQTMFLNPARRGMLDQRTVERAGPRCGSWE